VKRNRKPNQTAAAALLPNLDIQAKRDRPSIKAITPVAIRTLSNDIEFQR
jgi:hypothetical protein